MRFITATLLPVFAAAIGIISTAQGGDASLTLTSSAFVNMGAIPMKYTCDGAELSPPLSWKGLPSGTKSIALIMSDPDAPDPAAPQMTWSHWILYDLPPGSDGLPEGVKTLPAGGRQGTNDWERPGYGGPCPPVGRHRYFFRVYALDGVLPLLKAPTMANLERAMKGHVLGQAELVGVYSRQQ